MTATANRKAIFRRCRQCEYARFRQTMHTATSLHGWKCSRDRHRPRPGDWRACCQSHVLPGLPFRLSHTRCASAGVNLAAYTLSGSLRRAMR